jgi:hypothetical protein
VTTAVVERAARARRADGDKGEFHALIEKLEPWLESRVGKLEAARPRQARRAYRR